LGILLEKFTVLNSYVKLTPRQFSLKPNLYLIRLSWRLSILNITFPQLHSWRIIYMISKKFLFDFPALRWKQWEKFSDQLDFDPIL